MPEDQPPFVITEESPTPIVRDFGLFLDAVEQPSAYLTKARQALDRKTLYALNQSMGTMQTETHPRTDQLYYPLLNFFQRISIAGRFHVLGYEKRKLHMQPTERVAEFRALCPAARYLALLEAFWVDCDWEDLGVERRPFLVLDEDDLGRHCEETLARLPAGKTIDLTKSRFADGILFSSVHAVLPLFSFFGFLDYTPLPPGRYHLVKGEVLVGSFTVSPLGKAFLTVLHEKRPRPLWNLPSRREWGAEPARFPGENIEPGDGGVTEPTPFHEAFLPLLPPDAVPAALSRPTADWKPQTFVFRASLGGDVWRTIACSDEHTLEALHLAIQEAFRFDNDHLYAFYMDGKRYSRHAYNDPRGGEGPFADDVALAELDLYVGQRLLYLFDFGDNWEFDVELLEVRDEPLKGNPKILKEKGKSPEQYPDWDDEEW